ncbi:retinal homeobox protein Rx2-like [Ruditapes philippinarum]|uniref:retinal homeobox protein Rx2-like n=1 Tax=Ruditapes philippinarum TaxID=129788 RepID=UPI00295ADAD1|nr:retinal homeobox protein Rx2-like [Ruditapes philippinarum]
MMENIGKDLNITEKQVKIWFKKKRARWRRRTHDNKNHVQSFFPTTPMMPQATSFGYMPTGHMMMSSPLNNFHGYMSYPWMQGYASHNFMNQHLLGQKLANHFPLNKQLANQDAAFKSDASYALNTDPSVSTIPSAQYGKMLPQQNLSYQNRQPLKFPGYV